MSGGQCQRLALARSLLSDARFLISMSPSLILTPGCCGVMEGVLDHRTGRSVLDHRTGRSVLVITHAGEVLDGFERVLAMTRGHVQAVPRARLARS